MFLFFIPAVWQGKIINSTFFLHFLWDGCDLVFIIFPALTPLTLSNLSPDPKRSIARFASPDQVYKGVLKRCRDIGIFSRL
jgi:hypothetical protein